MRGPIKLMRGPINQAVNEANQTGHRGHGGTIRGNQRQSEAIRGNQYSLEAFRPCLAKHVEDRRWPCIQDKSTRTRIPEMTAILKLAPMATKAGGADATAIPADAAPVGAGAKVVLGAVATAVDRMAEERRERRWVRTVWRRRRPRGRWAQGRRPLWRGRHGGRHHWRRWRVRRSSWR
jgi:hypothetical protein